MEDREILGTFIAVLPVCCSRNSGMGRRHPWMASTQTISTAAGDQFVVAAHA